MRGLYDFFIGSYSGVYPTKIKAADIRNRIKNRNLLLSPETNIFESDVLKDELCSYLIFVFSSFF